MIVGSILKGRSFDGFFRKNCIEPKSIIDRHKEIKNEMLSRGMNHKSYICDQVNSDEKTRIFYDFVEKHKRIRVDIQKYRDLLTGRCSECKARMAL